MPKYEAHRIVSANGENLFNAEFGNHSQFKEILISKIEVEGVQSNNSEILIYMKDERIIYLLKAKYNFEEIKSEIGNNFNRSSI